MKQKDIGRLTLEHPSHATTFNTWMIDQFKTHLQSPILEIGSGNGNLTTILLQNRYNITATDMTDDYLSILKEKFENHERIINIIFFNIETPRPPIDIKYNTILLTNVLEHTKDPVEGLIRLKDNLNSDGKIIILVPAYQWLFCKLDRNLGHVRRYSSSMLRDQLNQAGYELIEMKMFNAMGLLGWFFWGKLLNRSGLKLKLIKLYEILMPINYQVDKIFTQKVGLSHIAIARKR